MPKVNAPLFSLNGGEVGKEALARLDLERMQFAGSLYSNMLPRVVGSMTIRPGFQHVLDMLPGGGQLMEYNYSGGSSLLPILSDGKLRIVKDDAYISRVSVSTTITNAGFGSFTGWTDASTGTATAGVSAGYLELLGTTQDTAAARQTIAVAAPDRFIEHGLRIVVTRGPIDVKLGANPGGSGFINIVGLQDGDHSIAFTPTAGVEMYLELSNPLARKALVVLCTIDGASVLALETPWTASDLDAKILRYTQHKDILYLSSTYYQQREIQRRGDRSWGVARYKVDDGPFVSSDGTISLQPNKYVDDGNATLTSNRSYFASTMVGRIFRIYQSGQRVNEVFSSDPATGAFIRVTGVGNARRIIYSVSGVWSGVVTLQRAIDDGAGNPTAWTTIRSMNTDVSDVTYEDPDDNVIKYFRFAILSGDLSSGTVVTDLSFRGGSSFGRARITNYISSTSAKVEILDRFYSLTPSFEWDFSVWSDFDGWPAAVEKFGGRLYWGTSDTIFGSVPDAYHSFDDAIEGASAPINRSIGTSTDRGILWLLGLQRLLAGTDSAEVSIKSSSFDEPLTGSSWFPVESSNRGCKPLRPVRCDQAGIFVQATGTGLFALVAEQGSLDYKSIDLAALHEHICDGFEVVDLAVQRRPDTMIWFVLSNGEARVLTYEPDEGVIAWSRVATDGQIKSVAATRGPGQDTIHMSVFRNGALRLERLADMADCKGGAINCIMDGHTKFELDAPQTSFSVPHLEGKQVVVWADGQAVHDMDNLKTVSVGGNVTLAVAATNVVIGLPYTGDFQSTKLAYGAQQGTALFMRKKVSTLGLYMVDTAVDKVLAGKDFDTLRQFTATENGRPLTSGEILDEFDADLNAISSDWDPDSRVCLRVRAPYPATFAAMVLDIKTQG